MKNKIAMVFLFWMGGIIGFFVRNSITRVPREVLTASHIGSLQKAISSYYDRTGNLPNGLDCLSLEPKEVLDAWGNPLLYIKEGNTQYILRSRRKIYMKNPVDGIVEKRIRVSTGSE